MIKKILYGIAAVFGMLAVSLIVLAMTILMLAQPAPAVKDPPPLNKDLKHFQRNF